MEPGSEHTLMDGRVRGASPVGLRAIAGRIFGRRRKYLVDPTYQVRSAVIAVLGMLFLLVFAVALFHLLSLENARLLLPHGPGSATTPGELRSVLCLVAVGLF